MHNCILVVTICPRNDKDFFVQRPAFPIEYLRHATLNNRSIAYFLGGVITIKLAVLFLVGPVIWPDTEAYISFADVILARAQVFDHMGFAGGPAAPILVFRLAGYPLVLAAA